MSRRKKPEWMKKLKKPKQKEAARLLLEKRYISLHEKLALGEKIELKDREFLKWFEKKQESESRDAKVKMLYNVILKRQFKETRWN